MIAALKERFPPTSFIEAVQVINPAFIPSDDEAKVEYGERTICTISQQFSTLLDKVVLLKEWNQFKFETLACPASVLQQSPCKYYQIYQSSYPELWKFVQLVSVLSASSACCEHGFSRMKVIKTDRRNKLSSDHLNSLMTVSLGDPDIILSNAIALWHARRRRCISTTPELLIVNGFKF